MIPNKETVSCCQSQRTDRQCLGLPSIFHKMVGLTVTFLREEEGTTVWPTIVQTCWAVVTLCTEVLHPIVCKLHIEYTFHTITMNCSVFTIYFFVYITKETQKFPVSSEFLITHQLFLYYTSHNISIIMYQQKNSAITIIFFSHSLVYYLTLGVDQLWTCCTLQLQLFTHVI